MKNETGTKRNAPGPDVVEFVSHEVLSLFPSTGKSLDLPEKEFPEVPWDAPETWANVADFGPPREVKLVHLERKKENKTMTDWSEALQRAIDSGATTVYFPANGKEMPVLGTVHLRGKLRRLIGCEVEMGNIVRHTDRPTDFQEEFRPRFILSDGDSPTVVVENFSSWYASPGFEQKSGRALVIRSMSIYEMLTHPGGGDVFLDDVRGKQLLVEGSSVWARQLNLEGHEDPRILVEGGKLRLLGLKTEGSADIAKVRGGGSMEILGGFVYANRDGRESTMFTSEDSAFSVTIGEYNSGKKGKPFGTLVRETRAGNTRSLKHGQAPDRTYGNMLPLFSGAEK